MMDKVKYAEAVNTLVGLAKQENEEGRAAAQVLLSAQDGSLWQVNIADLCALDGAHYEAALSVIRGRVELGHKPEELLQENSGVLHELSSRWQKLQVTNRGKPSCRECCGTGLVAEFPDDDFNHSEIPCPSCEGKGY